jgi:hypothetical protein
LRDVGELGLRLAEDPALKRLLEQGDDAGLQAFLQRHSPRDERVTNWNVFDREGRQRAVSPQAGHDHGEDYGWRDYFQGAKLRQREMGLESVYVSRAYHSRTDNLYKFAIGVPVRSGPAFLGVITATIKTTPRLGSLNLSDERRKFVLVGCLDPNPPDGRPAEATPEHLILVHPEYQPGQLPVLVPGEKIRRISRTRAEDVFHRPPSHAVHEPAFQDPDYRDPLDGDRWLAGFAQVGNTELVVIVQQRYSEVIEPYASRVRDLVLLSGIVLSLVVILLAGGLLYGSGAR